MYITTYFYPTIYLKIYVDDTVSLIGTVSWNLPLGDMKYSFVSYKFTVSISFHFIPLT